MVICRKNIELKSLGQNKDIISKPFSVLPNKFLKNITLVHLFPDGAGGDPVGLDVITGPLSWTVAQARNSGRRCFICIYSI